ncbi:MAG: ABC transporter permease [Candidatus Moranbacteria bacterium]|nr:ABC transporter permease [Candidatus Moranbacteria bacterium]NTW46100.1 ABC transporter permease [Candidatus Moranbacteria bacterium]
MLPTDLLRLSLRMFKARALRTFLTILGMGVGIAAIVFLVSFGYGLQRTLLQKITTSDALSTLDVTADSQDAPKLDAGTASLLSSLPDVETVVPVNEVRGQIKVGSVTLDTGAVVALPKYLDLEGAKFSSGRPASDRQETVVTAGVAKAFGREPADLVGETVAVTLFGLASDGKPLSPDGGFLITGIVQSDENLFYLAPGSLNVPLPPATLIKVKGMSTDALPALREGVRGLGLAASSISETVDQANKVFQAIQLLLMSFGVIALVVSAIGMFNTMTITLLERTEEIGIMKSIGASPGSISLMFVMESTLMGLLGSLVGILLGLLGGEAINAVFNLIATNFGGQKADLFYSPLWFLSSIVVFGAFVGFLTGIIPARKAAKTDALEALRYK